MTAKKTEGFPSQRDIQESEASGVQPGGRGQLYYVQDTRQMVGNCMLWWCPDRKGYTTQIDEAGLYTYETKCTERMVAYMHADDLAEQKHPMPELDGVVHEAFPEATP
jgi:hypothetical protein